MKGHLRQKEGAENAVQKLLVCRKAERWAKYSTLPEQKQPVAHKVAVDSPLSFPETAGPGPVGEHSCCFILVIYD